MKLAQLLTQSQSTNGFNLNRDQVKNLRSRLRFAEVDCEDIQEGGEMTLVIDLISKIATAPPNGMPRQAMTRVASAGCPRCSSVLSSIKLADQQPGQYCGNCRVVVPGM